MMDAEQILRLIALFYNNSFGLNEATGLFGADGRSTPLTSNLLKLQVTDKNLEEAWVEILDKKSPADDQFCAGIIVRLSKAALINLSPFEERFGSPRELPLDKPWSDQVLQFMITGMDFEGYILLSVRNSEAREETQALTQFILRRFPK